jgi:hypothetical protein
MLSSSILAHWAVLEDVRAVCPEEETVVLSVEETATGLGGERTGESVSDRAGNSLSAMSQG